MLIVSVNLKKKKRLQNKVIRLSPFGPSVGATGEERPFSNYSYAPELVSPEG